MTTLIFTTTGTGTPVSVSGNIVYGTKKYSKRINQVILETSDGGSIVYSNGTIVTYSTILMKNVSKAHGVAFESWLLTSVMLALNTFGITGVPSNVDIGAGFGQSISGARFMSDSTEGLLDFVAPGFFNIEFPIRIGG